MPKPIFQDKGSGMHTHVSFWKDGQTLVFNENGYAGLSELAVHYTCKRDNEINAIHLRPHPYEFALYYNV